MTSTALEEALAPIRSKLQTAVSLELTTLPPYLLAMYSIKPGRCVAAAGLIRSVFMEEMLHMVLAANILTAIGGKLELDERTVPTYPCRLHFEGKAFADRDFDVHLAALSRETLCTFLRIELPQTMSPRLRVASVDQIDIPDYTVGEFYGSIAADLRSVCEVHGPADVFRGSPERQVSEQFFWGAGGRPIRVSSLETAEAAVELIVVQGEGAVAPPGAPQTFSEDRLVPHYYRFNEILWQRRYGVGDDIRKPPATGEALPVNYEADIYPLKPNCVDADFRGQRKLEHLNHLFNNNYTTMLAQIAEGFNGNPAVFYTAIINGMRSLTPIAQQMVEWPLPDDAQKRHGAPSFSWLQSTGERLHA